MHQGSPQPHSTPRTPQNPALHPQGHCSPTAPSGNPKSCSSTEGSLGLQSTLSDRLSHTPQSPQPHGAPEGSLEAHPTAPRGPHSTPRTPQNPATHPMRPGGHPASGNPITWGTKGSPHPRRILRGPCDTAHRETGHQGLTAPQDTPKRRCGGSGDPKSQPTPGERSPCS